MILIFIATAMPIHASTVLEQCSSAKKTSISYLRCLDRQIELLDSKRKLWGNNVIFMLEERNKNSGRKGGALRIFKKSQKSYVKHSENNCRWQYINLLPDPTSSAIKYKECMIMMGENRVTELQSVVKK